MDSQFELLLRLLWQLLMRRNGRSTLAPRIQSWRNTMGGTYIVNMILLFIASFCLLDKLVLFFMFFYFAGLRTFSRRSTKQTGNPNLRLLEYGKFPSCVVCQNLPESSHCMSWYWNLAGMNIVWSMTWLHMRLRVKEAMCGLARTMMEMCRVISWLKVIIC